MKYDVIGDVHGQTDKLVTLLNKMGYKKTTQGYSHLENKVIFVGDLIDRGPKQVELLSLVREMQQNDNALIVMGNHEFNAIGWHTKCNDGEGYLRSHIERHHRQHHIFLDQIGENSQQHDDWIQWMKSLPLFLDLGELRVVHACWKSSVIQSLKPYLTQNNQLKEAHWQQAFNPHDPLIKWCEIILKGEDIWLPDELFYHDKEGNKRKKMRVRWWADKVKTWEDLAVNGPKELMNQLQGEIDYKVDLYQEDTPVIFGHYWFLGEPHILTPKLACVDYSAAIGTHPLVAYRFQGERCLSNDHFIA